MYTLMIFLAILFSGVSFNLLQNKQSLLSVLVSLEMLMFLTIFLFCMPMIYYFNSMTYFITLLCFAASGAALGLTLLVSMSRLHGNDLLHNLYLYEKNPSSWNAT
uniref:NADH dehydrogenase subunit 4L n=1 Tax=Micrarionta opuntia TaxID=2914219 RepID=UPI001EF9D9EC|nr:NADH dehydrogenase subunit 4L [Micrarionta opuntia]UKG20825.1 NADH dehydrogenase subunit 4L [Micrarionta opuntia]